jgi:hypothetical protein
MENDTQGHDEGSARLGLIVGTILAGAALAALGAIWLFGHEINQLIEHFLNM